MAIVKTAYQIAQELILRLKGEKPCSFTIKPSNKTTDRVEVAASSKDGDIVINIVTTRSGVSSEVLFAEATPSLWEGSSICAWLQAPVSNSTRRSSRNKTLTYQ